jgi:ATP-dependent Zn protease
MEPNPDVLRANAYHEAGHAIVGWALGLYVQEIAIRDDRPGENTKFTGHAEHLPLVDQVAICTAGRQAEETFRHLLPSWASGGDWADTLNLLAAYDICENPEIDQWFANGRARARELLIKHRREVRRLAARLIESRRMTADEFERFMQASM